MIISQFCQVGDIGVALVVQAINQSNNLPFDISGATDLKIRVGYPDGTGVDFTAELLTDGTDGKMVYDTAEGDLDQVGVHSIQGHATGLSYDLWTEKKYLEVQDNIVDPVVPGP